MNEVGVEIVKTEEVKESGIKYLNINVSNSEVERKPDIVRLCADAGILEYVKPSGDTVSRQAVLDVLDENSFTDSCIKVRQLTSVNPQPKAGHWTHDGSHWKNRFLCSECNYKLFDEPTNFCPNCGAKMIEPQESEEV